MSVNNATDYYTAPPLFKDDEKSFLLVKLEVYNWGPFSRRHIAEIHEDGTAIIGTTGSGKTTLIDALMTLLVASPKYNLASTGGHDLKNDRDLVSYVRGVTGAESVSGGNDHILRSGKTITGISAKYENGTSQILIGALLWMDGSGRSASDLKKLWFIYEGDMVDLGRLLNTLSDGGSREVKKISKETPGLNVFSSKKEYLARIQRFFEVGANAFPLLNRAAGLKQLNSINQIFRELVLEDKSAFQKALKVAQNFDTLAVIREELEIARKQRDSLLPVKKEHQALLKTDQKLAVAKQLRSVIPIWFAMIGADLWQKKVDEVSHRKIELERELNERKQEKLGLEMEAETLKSIYMEMGGAAIEEVKRTIALERERLVEKEKDAQLYQKWVAALDLDTEISAEQFAQNQKKLQVLDVEKKQEGDSINTQQIQLQAEMNPYRERQREIEEEILNIQKRPGSNIESKFQRFRDLLAEELGLKSDDLPFVAEMIEVKDKAWRGAIERALGSERLRILVPEVHFKQALRWVNNRNNKLHVRLVLARDHAFEQEPFQDSFIHKLKIKEHALETALYDLLIQQDRHCVAHVEELEHTQYAMTIEGTMSGREGRVDKQDQRPLNAGWMTGFDNKDRLMELEKSLKEIRDYLKLAKIRERELKELYSKNEEAKFCIRQLLSVGFSSIDAQSVKVRLESAQSQLDRLTDPESDLAKARESYELVIEKIRQVGIFVEELLGKVGGVKSQLEMMERNLNDALSRMENGLDEASLALAEQNAPKTQFKNPDQLQDAERESAVKVKEKIAHL
jgi:uncharacterized protein YPO0396